MPGFQSAPRLSTGAIEAYADIFPWNNRFQSAPRPFDRGDEREVKYQRGVRTLPKFQSAPRPFDRGDVNNLSVRA